jgi:hypothetical protein
VVAGVRCQPAANCECLMGSVVVHHNMNVQVWWSGNVDSVEKFPKLDGAVSALTCSQNLAGFHVKGSKEGCCAVPRVVMGAALHLSRAHGQQRLCPVKRLDLGLFVHTQDQSPVGRVHIQPHDIPDLLDEQRISGKLEALGAMGLAEQKPARYDSPHSDSDRFFEPANECSSGWRR